MTRTCLSYNKARCQQVYLPALSVGPTSPGRRPGGAHDPTRLMFPDEMR